MSYQIKHVYRLFVICAVLAILISAVSLDSSRAYAAPAHDLNNSTSNPPLVGWSKPVGGTDVDRVNDITRDSRGDVYITGTKIISYNNTVLFVKKMSVDGFVLWSQTFSASSYSNITGDAIAVDSYGHVYVVGGAENWPMSGSASTHGIVICLNNYTGSLIWKTISENVGEHDVKVNAQGQVYTLGMRDTNSDGNHDGIVSRVNPVNGTIMSTVYLGLPGMVFPTSMAVSDGGNVYVGGFFLTWGTVCDAGSCWQTTYSNAFVTGIANDEVSWNNLIGDPESNDWISEIALGANGDIYAIGASQVMWGSPLNTVSSSDNYDAHTFVAKLGGGGNILWNTFYTYHSGNGEDRPDSIFVDWMDNVYISGRADHPSGPSAGLGRDEYISKFTADGSRVWNTFVYGEFTIGIGESHIVGGSDGKIFIANYRNRGPRSIFGTSYVTKLLDGIKQPVVIVHGFQGFSTSGYNADQFIQLYDGANSTLDSAPQWFADHGYEVWIAHLTTSFWHTSSLSENSKVLAEQLRFVARRNPYPITVVSHSMGGVVSRGAISLLGPDKSHIKALYTMGTPNAGLPSEEIINTLSKLWVTSHHLTDDIVIDGIPIPLDDDHYLIEDEQNIEGFMCQWQPGVCDMSFSNILNWNSSNPNSRGIQYTFIGGAAEQDLAFIMDVAYGIGPNDGLVPTRSAIGWNYKTRQFDPSWWPTASLPRQYVTDEYHNGQMAFRAAQYNNYMNAPAGQMSDTVTCILDLMENRSPSSSKCTVPPPSSRSARTAPSPSFVFSVGTSGHLDTGESVSITQQVDTTGQSRFELYASTATSDFTLTRPDGQVVDPAYAAANPSEVVLVSDVSTSPSQAYVFSTTQPGTWQVNIAAGEETNYFTTVLLESNRTLSVQPDKDTYQIGDIATLTARLENNGTGLTGANITATIIFVGETTQVISLADQGDGNYSAAFNIPDAAGLFTVEVVAQGSDSEIGYNRQESLILGIAPNTVQLTGSYGAQTPDTDYDGQYDSLDISLGVNVTQAGSYNVTALLYSGDQMVSQSADIFDLVEGSQTITLHFNSSDIRLSDLDGPYTVSGVFLTPIGIGIAAQNADNVWTTPAYDHNLFFAPTISGNAKVAGVTLTYNDMGVDKTILTDSEGYYSFQVSNNWSGVVTPSKSGYVFGPDNMNYIGIVIDQELQDYLVETITYTISGNAGIAFTTLSYVQDGETKTTTADEAGNYTLAVPYGWSGTVTPFLPDYTFTPASRNYAGVISDLTGMNYSAEPLLDTIAPSAVTDLVAASGPGNGTVILTWTAPGDNGSTGTASSYEVRYSLSAISNEVAWDAATSVVSGIPAPQPAGQIQTMTVSGLPTETFYFFAVRARDEVPNLGELSNNPCTVAGPPPQGAGTYDDTHPAFKYSGTWTAGTSAGPYNSTYHYTSAANASATFTFVGTGFTLTYLKASTYGNLLVYVDNTLVTTINEYKASTLWQQVWVSPTYTYGVHIVRLARSTGVVGIDAITIQGTADTTPPSEITDLAVANGTTQGDINLSWTAPGDDGASGYVATYNIRLSTSPIVDDASWNAAVQYGSSVSLYQMAGTAQSMTLSGLPAATYYVAVRGVDEAGNLGPLSNNPSVTVGGVSPESGPFTYDDTHPAFKYSGTWIAGTHTGPYNSTYHYTSATNASATFTFVGTGFTLTYLKASTYGNMLVYVDNTLVTTINENNTSTVWNQTWNSPTLTEGIHVVKLVRSSGTVGVDAITIQGTDDTTAPSEITDLAVANGTTQGDINLSWTAPGDDGASGYVATYNIRLSTSPIVDDASWNAAVQYGSSISLYKMAGTAQSMTLSGLPAATYYVAVRGVDEVGNLGSLSNNPSVIVGGVPPESGPFTYDDTHPAFKYSGTWTAGTYNGPYNSTYHYTSATNASATFNFVGTGFTLTYLKASSYGNMLVYVDNTLVTTINENNASTVWNQTWNSPTLTEGIHVVKLVHSTGTSVGVDAITIQGTADTTAPSEITDLAVANSTTQGDINLSWTAPGDDGASGYEATYNIRLSTSPIVDDASWNAAVQYGSSISLYQMAGTAQSMTLSGLPAATYYVAVRGVDEAGNLGPLSNNPSVVVGGAPAAGAGTYDDTHSGWKYSSGWMLSTAYPTGPYNGSFHYTTTVNASVTFAFTGTRFSLTYLKGNSYGNLQVYIDGNLAATINEYNASTLWQQIWSSGVLTSGIHVVRLVHQSGTYVGVDGITIQP